MKRFQLWIKRPSLALPVCSSESARIRPSAEASGMVRKALRKLLAFTQRDGGGNKGEGCQVTGRGQLRKNRWVILVPDTDLLATNPTCGRGIQVHRPSRTPSGTDGSAPNTGSAPGNTKPVQAQKRTHFSSTFKPLKEAAPSHLDHAVAVGVGDVRLQASKQGPVVMFEIKVLQSKFGVFNCDLVEYRSCYFDSCGKQIKDRTTPTFLYFLVTM